MATSCSTMGWKSAKEAVTTIFQRAAASDPHHNNHASDTLRRNISLIQSMDETFGTQEGILGDRSVWEYYVDAAKQHARNPAATPTIPPFCSTFACPGGDHNQTTSTSLSRSSPLSRNNSKAPPEATAESPDPPPSRESSDVSTVMRRRVKAAHATRYAAAASQGPPAHLVLYRPTKRILATQLLDVAWTRACLHLPDRLVRWGGSLEITTSPTLVDATPTDVRSLSTASAADSEVGWITSYALEEGITKDACLLAKDPVLTHFCQRFGLWPAAPGRSVPSSPTLARLLLEDDTLFHPYGTVAAQEELAQRVAANGGKADATVLPVAAVLAAVPVFLISDVFVDPDFRGAGLGLLLLDRMARCVADTPCLIVVFLRDYTDERLPLYLGLLGFSFLAPGFLMRRNGYGDKPPRLEEVCPFVPTHLLTAAHTPMERLV
jgi:GNAT superfamily N-acetyltransferase